MDQLIENQAEGDWVDREYCARVTLAYLAYVDAKQAARNNTDGT